MQLNPALMAVETANEADLMATENLALLSEDQLRQIVRDHATTAKVSLSQIARQVGVADSTFSAYINNSYKGDNERISNQVRNWVQSLKLIQIQRAIAPRHAKFVLTGTAAKFNTVLEYAQSTPDIGVMIGRPGTGKTATINHYKATHSNVWLMTASPSLSQPSAVLDALREVLGVPVMRYHLMLRQIINRLRGTNGLIVVDEAQFLKPLALDELRGLHDQADIGLVFAGNEEVWRQLSGSGDAAKFAQLHSRVGAKVNITKPRLQDIADILDAYGITDKPQRDLLSGIALKPGNLRGMFKTYNLALRVAHGNERELTLVDIQAAWGHRAGALDGES